MCLFVMDIFSDIGTGISFLISQNYWWAALTFFFVAFPWLVALLEVLLNPITISENKIKDWWNEINLIPHDCKIINTGRAFQQERALKRFNVEKYHAWIEAQRAANDIRLKECTFEASPQVILQLYMLLVDMEQPFIPGRTLVSWQNVALFWRLISILLSFSIYLHS